MAFMYPVSNERLEYKNLEEYQNKHFDVGILVAGGGTEALRLINFFGNVDRWYIIDLSKEQLVHFYNLLKIATIEDKEKRTTAYYEYIRQINQEQNDNAYLRLDYESIKFYGQNFPYISEEKVKKILDMPEWISSNTFENAVKRKIYEGNLDLEDAISKFTYKRGNYLFYTSNLLGSKWMSDKSTLKILSEIKENDSIDYAIIISAPNHSGENFPYTIVKERDGDKSALKLLKHN